MYAVYHCISELQLHAFLVMFLLQRKLYGFNSHSSHYGCSKCFKFFPENVKDSFDFSGFKREEWPKQDMRSHKRRARELLRAKTEAERDRLSKRYGLYYSVLLE